MHRIRCFRLFQVQQASALLATRHFSTSITPTRCRAWVSTVCIVQSEMAFLLDPEHAHSVSNNYVCCVTEMRWQEFKSCQFALFSSQPDAAVLLLSTCSCSNIGTHDRFASTTVVHDITMTCLQTLYHAQQGLRHGPLFLVESLMLMCHSRSTRSTSKQHTSKASSVW